MATPPVGTQCNITPGAQVVQLGDHTWRLEIPAGPGGRYRLAQIDDYGNLPRRAFLWNPPLRLELRARASHDVIPGTWGFGLWNDPFGMAVLGGFEKLRLPVLPNAAWFFFASAPNYLSLRDDLPAYGSLAAAFNAPHWPPLALTPGALLFPLLLLPPAVRVLRRLARQIVHQDSANLTLDPMKWHTYRLDWLERELFYYVDDEVVLRTAVGPRGPLGLVIWVDNQYAAMPPTGRLRYGMLPNPEPAWIEIDDITLVGHR